MARRIESRSALLLITSSLLIGCASIDDRVKASEAAPGEINWPAEYHPESATFFVHHRIDIAAPPEVVWSVLIEAETWPDWYEGASNVAVEGSSDVLHQNGAFTWNTMGLNLTSRIAEFEPPNRLSWESNHRFIDGYHAWLILPNETGSILVTDESMGGFLAHMQRIFQPNRLNRWHEEWLRQIKSRSELRSSAASR